MTYYDTIHPSLGHHLHHPFLGSLPPLDQYKPSGPMLPPSSLDPSSAASIYHHPRHHGNAMGRSIRTTTVTNNTLLAPPPFHPYSSHGTTFFLPPVIPNNAPLVIRPPVHAPPVNQEPLVSGGVSATLDYLIEDMAEFVATMALGIMGPPTSTNNSISGAFIKFSSQVLTATRLPKATIILGLVYLSKRWALGNISSSIEYDNNSIYYKMFVVSLLLANKFHDDNTFTNVSWHEATGIPTSDLTRIEADWLGRIKWSLHLSNNDLRGWNKWNDCWEYWVSSHNKSPISTSFAAFPNSSYSLNNRSTSSERSRQLLASPGRPTYTIPKWYETAHATAGISSSTFPSDDLLARTVSYGSTSSSPNSVVTPTEPFVSYFQQSFAGGAGSIGPPPLMVDSAYSHEPEIHVNGLSSNPPPGFQIPGYNPTAACNCNLCSFELPKHPNWFSNSIATVC